MRPNLKNLSIYIGSFFITCGLSFYLFQTLLPVNSAGKKVDSNSSAPTAPPQTGVITFSGPKTEICPLNGQLFTKEEKDIWSQRRPLVVMIENHEEARPQSGLQNADIVYEVMSEGAISRFMAVFYCNVVKGAPNKYDVGPVRSARTYFLDLASEYADYPLYAHVGGSNCSAPKDPVTGRQSGPCTTNTKAQALEQLSSYGWRSNGTYGDLDQFSLSYKACRREPDRTGVTKSTEHTMYCSTNELWNVASQRGLTNMTQVNKTSWDKNYRPWLFKAEYKANSSPTTSNIDFEFWTGYKAYAGNWTYDKINNLYLRSNGGAKHVDFNTQAQISTKNVIIQFVKETRSVDEHLHNLEAVVGSGTGVLFQNGTSTPVTWSKTNRVSRTIFKDKSGKEVNFVPGQIWIEVLPIGSALTYEGQS